MEERLSGPSAKKHQIVTPRSKGARAANLFKLQHDFMLWRKKPVNNSNNRLSVKSPSFQLVIGDSPPMRLISVSLLYSYCGRQRKNLVLFQALTSWH
jgi:hypothetical protein